MDAKERYFWDITGYLVVRNVLSPQDLKAAHKTLDYARKWVGTGEEDRGAADSAFLKGTGARWYHGDNLLNLPEPYCDPVRHMLAHPKIVSRLNVMCGPYSGHGGRVPYLTVEEDGAVRIEGKQPVARSR